MRTLVALILVAAGCDGGSGKGHSTDFDGIYNVASWTYNDAACDAEGASIKDQRDPVFFVKYEGFLDYHALNVRMCTDLADCQMQFADDGTIHISAHSYETGNTTDGWTDVHGSAFVTGGMCEGENIEDRLVRDGADGVRIETRATRVMFAPTADNECTDEATAAAAAGVPCSNFEVIVGSFVEN